MAGAASCWRSSCWRSSASTRSSCSRAPRPATRRSDGYLAARPAVPDPARRCCRSASRSCSAPPGCRTSSCASSPCPTRRPRAARVGWAVFLIGAFYLMVMVVGVGARGDPRPGGRGGGRQGRQPRGADCSPRRSAAARASIGGDVFLAFIAAVAFATILAVVAGLVISASGAVAHDLWSNVVRKRPRLRARGDLRRADRGARRSARSRSCIAIIGGVGAERLVHGRPRVRRRGERELPGARCSR